MQAGLYFGDVKMKTNQPNFGGWLASTEKEPNQLLHTIWLRAREDYTGLIGKSGLKENILVFSGIQIRIKDKEPTSNDLGYPLVLEITNWERIEPDFFDLWEYLKANHLVHGGPDEEDKAYFVGGKYAEIQELDYWTDIYYSIPINRINSRMTQLQNNYDNFPSGITERKIQDRAREREKWGEKFPYKITRKKK